MDDLAVWVLHRATINGSESVLIELDRASCVANRQGRSECVVSLRNGFYCHDDLLGWKFRPVYTSKRGWKRHFGKCDLPLTFFPPKNRTFSVLGCYVYQFLARSSDGMAGEMRDQKNRVTPSSRTTTRSSMPAARASWSSSCNGSSTGSCERRKVP